MKQLLILISIALVACQPPSTQSSTETQEAQTSTPTDAAAQLLIDARIQNKLITLPDSLSPSDLSEGYQIQDRIIETIGTPLIGWKVAITSDELMQKAGVTEPVSGPLFQKWLSTSPHKITDGEPTLYGVEFEIAFKMASDLPPRDTPYTQQEVMAAVESMHLAIEPVGTRYNEGPVKSGVFRFAADHGGNYSFIHGPAIADWQSIDLASIQVTAYFDDQQQAQALGSNVLGSPLHSLTWLANQLISRGHQLKAGQWVTTGAVVGPLPVKPPVQIRGDFGELGSLRFDFEG